MSRLRNVNDLSAGQTSEQLRERIGSFVERGHDEKHLVVNDEDRVFLDKELAENDAFDEIMYAPHRQSD